MSRAVGIVRVSRVGKREKDEKFHSPKTQREQIEQACERQELKLVATYEEMNISGGSNLEKRTGLREALAAIESGRAEVVVVAYFDRLFRSLKVQTEVIERVEQAGGRLLAVDVGKVSNGTAAEWLNSTMHGMFAEYVRRQTAEKTGEAQTSAIEKGIPPYALIPGLIRVGDRVELDPVLAPVVREAVEMRAEGAPVAEVREYLRQNGIKRSYHGTMSLLRSRLLIGEIVFGDQRGNVPAIVEDAKVWERALRTKSPRGRKGKSDRLLARLGVLRCATCGARMVVASANRSQYRIYRCPPTGDCPRRVTISAEVAERVVTDAVRPYLEGTVGVKAVRNNVRKVRVEAERAQANLDGFIRMLAGDEDESSTIERLRELRERRDRTRAAAESLDLDDLDEVLLLGADWDQLSLVDKQRSIKAVLERVDVHPSDARRRGEDRLVLKFHDPLARLMGQTPQPPSELS